MPIKNYFMLIALLIVVNSYAVNKNAYECIYEYKVNNGGTGEDYSTILMFDNASAMFCDYSAYLLDSVSVVGGTYEEQKRYEKQMMGNEYFFDQTIFQNIPETKNTVCGIITPDYYCYTEDAFSIAWTLTEETDTVCGYLCNKATGEYGGRVWTAWYTSQIPTTYGPWKLCGLPGLVLRAVDSESKLTIEAISFRKGNIRMPSPKTKNCIMTTREKFIKAKNQFESNPMGNIPFESIGQVHIEKQEGGKGAVLIDGMQLRFHPKGYVALELK